MKNILFVLALSVILVVVVTAAFAEDSSAPVGPVNSVTQQKPIMPPASKTPYPAPCIAPTLRVLQSSMLPMLTTRLNLTADQQTKIKDLVTQCEQACLPKIEAQIQATQNYITLLTKDGVTEAELTAAVNTTMKAEGDILIEKVKTLTAIRALLTPDQNKTLTEMLTQWTSPWQQKKR